MLNFTQVKFAFCQVRFQFHVQVKISMILNMQFNNFSGTLGSPTGYNHLNTAFIQNSSFDLTATLLALIDGGHVTDLDAAYNR